MSNSREIILNKLRAARRPFEDAPPRPRQYIPVTTLDDTSPDALLKRFTAELERLKGSVHPVADDQAACDCILDLLRQHNTDHVLTWDFQHIPVKGLQAALKTAGITVTLPDLHDEFRAEHAEYIKGAGAGIVGVNAAAAGTGTLIFNAEPGKGRVPTVLPPVLIAVLRLDQLLPNVEAWLARERTQGMATILGSSNVCFVSGPSRTGDIEMQLVLGVHGPGVVHAIVKK